MKDVVKVNPPELECKGGLLNAKGKQSLHESIERDIRAWELLELINAEFQSDPAACQCFDLRLVKEVDDILKAKKNSVL